MNRKIVADSSVNLYTSALPNFTAVPLKVITSEKEYIDDERLNIDVMQSEMETYKGKSSTACPAVSEWMDAFGDADEVFAVSLTSSLSGGYNAACIAAADYMCEHPGRRVFVFDSLSTGPEIELIVEQTARFIAKEKSFEDICEKIRAYAEHTHLLFSLESLSNFAKNGRVSAVEAKAVGLLGIRIVGRGSVDGKLELLHKCRGGKKAVAKIFEEMLANGFNGGRVRIRHTLNPDGAAQLERLISEAFPACDVKVDINHGLCSYYAQHGGMLIGYEDSAAKN